MDADPQPYKKAPKKCLTSHLDIDVGVGGGPPADGDGVWLDVLD
jgi:hypothetical protein